MREVGTCTSRTVFGALFLRSSLEASSARRRSFAARRRLVHRCSDRGPCNPQIKSCGLVILLTIALSVGASHSRGLARLGGSFRAQRSRSVDQSLKSLSCPQVCITIAHEPTTR